jgi:hypothetical protein
MKTCWLHFHSFFWDLELTFIPKNMVKNCMLKLISSFLCHDLELVCRLKLTLKITISSHICFLNEISFVEIFYIISEACLAYFSNNFGGSLLFSRFRITSFYLFVEVRWLSHQSLSWCLMRFCGGKHQRSSQVLLENKLFFQSKSYSQRRLLSTIHQVCIWSRLSFATKTSVRTLDFNNQQVQTCQE